MSTLADRIIKVRSELGLSQAEFGRLIGKSRSAINQIEKGDTKSLKASTAAAIEKASGFSGLWVETGKGGERSRPGTLPDGSEGQIDKIYRGLLALPKEHRDKIEAEIDFLISLNESSE